MRVNVQAADCLNVVSTTRRASNRPDDRFSLYVGIRFAGELGDLDNNAVTFWVNGRNELEAWIELSEIMYSAHQECLARAQVAVVTPSKPAEPAEAPGEASAGTGKAR